MGDVIQLRHKPPTPLAEGKRATYHNPVTYLTARPAPCTMRTEDGSLATYEFAKRSERDAFVRTTPGAWAGYKLTIHGFQWFAFVME